MRGENPLLDMVHDIEQKMGRRMTEKEYEEQELVLTRMVRLESIVTDLCKNISDLPREVKENIRNWR